MRKKIRVLIIDDSAMVREILEKGLSTDPAIEIVGKAADVYAARDKIVFLKPDVLTLDIEMPRMDGVEFLKRLMPQYPLPVIIVSSLTKEGSKITLDAMESGAVDYVLKPSSNIGSGLKDMMLDLIEKVKMASGVDVSKWKRTDAKEIIRKKNYKILEGSTDKVISIGASTGGTVAITRIINEFPADMPGTVIVQHMPPVFTRMFAESLNKSSKVAVKEAEDGDRIITGRVLVAPGDFHMEVKRSGGQYVVRLGNGDKVNGHRPSVDILFYSVASEAGSNAVGILLTGMGKDGAEGLLEMRKSGASTLAQDEATSVVFGMPKAAYMIGGTDILVPLNKMTETVTEILNKK